MPLFSYRQPLLLTFLNIISCTKIGQASKPRKLTALKKCECSLTMLKIIYIVYFGARLNFLATHAFEIIDDNMNQEILTTTLIEVVRE